MTEEFNRLYNTLYRENISELERYRLSSRKGLIVIIAFFITFATIITMVIAIPSLMGFIPIIIIGMIIVMSLTFANNKGRKENVGEPAEGQNEEKKYCSMSNYQDFFKSKIVEPLILSINENAVYNPTSGIDIEIYGDAKFEYYCDRYKSEDQISILLPSDMSGQSKHITLSEVHTENKSTDKDGHTTYYTIFHGIMGYVDLDKVSDSYINIKRNGTVMKWNKNKLDMDMSEFEKYFDVETDNKIEAMQILTADVMTDLVDFILKSKTTFEIHILNGRMYMRFMTGPMFEPNFFGNSMEKELIWRYYNITKFCMDLSIKMCKIVNEAKI